MDSIKTIIDTVFISSDNLMNLVAEPSTTGILSYKIIKLIIALFVAFMLIKFKLPFKLFDSITDFDSEKELKVGNVAVGISYAAEIIGFTWIVVTFLNKI
jgi:uncharacterized membrane protein YjfL (UPF0719 family)